MKEIEEYKEFCKENGYKVSDAKALMKFYQQSKSRLIKSKMALVGDNFEVLGNFLGVTRQTAAMKVNGEADFTLTEINLLKNRYKLTNDEFIQIATKEVVTNERTRSSETIK